jgi:nucleotidyltransferase/DNA polymerase involved in DNA repair
MNDGRVLDCTAPDFIKRYFATSRLHHLSTWKAELAEYVAGQMAIQNRSSGGLTKKASAADEPFRTIMHIDMDCFFASVGMRDKPHLRDKPVAVAHSLGGVSLEYSTSEIASCNYVARAKGVKNGVYIGTAKELCPDLVIIPYNFEAYDACSRELYKALLDTADFVQAVSCDEAFIDVTFMVQRRMMDKTRASNVPELMRRFEEEETVTELYQTTAIDVATSIKTRILETTQCNASVGIAGNILLARLATKKAKPNGVYSLLGKDEGSQFLRTLSIRDLPGVGYSIAEKSAQLQLSTCADVQSSGGGLPSSLMMTRLKAELGDKTGEMLYNYCWGVDTRVLENKPRQTLGADINWGIRFTAEQQVDNFLKEFSSEVFGRLAAIHQTAKHVTVNVKKRDYEGEPEKFLGCGRCFDFSRSMVPGRAITGAAALYQCVAQLYREIGVQPLDARGIGIHLKKLQPIASAGSGAGLAFERWIAQDRKTEAGQGTRTVHVNSSAVPPAGFEQDDDEQHEAEARDILASAGGGREFEVRGVRSVASCSSLLSSQPSSPALSNTADQNLESRPQRAIADDKRTELSRDRENVNFIRATVASVGNSGTGDQNEAAANTDIRENGPQLSSASAARSTSSAPDLHGMTIGDIDLDVFLALPEDIQKELQGALGSRAVSNRPTAQSTTQKRKAPSAQGKGTGKAAKTSAGSEKRQPGLLEMWRRAT